MRTSMLSFSSFIKEFNENSLILLRQAEQIDTININSDGTFKYSLPIEKDGEYRLVILSDNQPNGNIPCYIAAGEKTCIEIAWEEKESSFMGNRRKYFSFVPYFSGGTQREYEFLNIPSYLDYKFNNPDGTPVPFKDYVWLEKIAEDKPAWKQFLIPEAFNSEFAKEYNITAIPRFMIFDDNAKIVSINAPRPSSSEIIKYLDSLSNTK